MRFFSPTGSVLPLAFHAAGLDAATLAFSNKDQRRGSWGIGTSGRRGARAREREREMTPLDQRTQDSCIFFFSAFFFVFLLKAVFLSEKTRTWRPECARVPQPSGCHDPDRRARARRVPLHRQRSPQGERRACVDVRGRERERESHHPNTHLSGEVAWRIDLERGGTTLRGGGPTPRRRPTPPTPTPPSGCSSSIEL